MSNQPTPDERAKSIMGSYCGPNTHHWPNGVCNMITDQIKEAIEVERERLLKMFEYKLKLISLAVRLEANLVDDDEVI